MEAHRELGPGLDEILYHHLLAEKLKRAGIAYQFKPRGNLVHKGIVADDLIVELKVLRESFDPEHWLQIICYQKFWNVHTGLLLDFGKESLVQKRVLWDCRTSVFSPADVVAKAPDYVSDRQVLKVVAESIGVIVSQYGLGYRGNTYQGLLNAELLSNALKCNRNPTIAVRATETVSAKLILECLIVEDKCALLVTALRDSYRSAARAVLQTYLRHLDLDWGIVAAFGKREFTYQFAMRPKSGFL